VVGTMAGGFPGASGDDTLLATVGISSPKTLGGSTVGDFSRGVDGLATGGSMPDADGFVLSGRPQK
jgi:hypothetical protein